MRDREERGGTQTVNDFKFAGKAGRTFAMMVKRGSNTAYIASYGWWKAEFKEDPNRAFHYLITTINHEHLHKVLLHVKGPTASRAIDKRQIFGADVGEQESFGLYVPIPSPEALPIVRA